MNYNNEDFKDNKNQRRENLKYKKKGKIETSDNFAAHKQAKKHLRSRKELLEEQELWDDWENIQE